MIQNFTLFFKRFIYCWFIILPISGKTFSLFLIFHESRKALNHNKNFHHLIISFILFDLLNQNLAQTKSGSV